MLNRWIHPRQRERLAPHLGNTNYLVSFLANDATHDDVHDMLVMELQGDKRRFIIDRLSGRLTTFYRQSLKKDIDMYIKQ